MILESQPDFEVVGTAADGAQAVQLVDELEPDVVLMDIRMPVLDGIQATQQIRRRHPVAPPHVLVLTTVKVDRALLEAIRAGASGFLLKDARSEFLMQSIRAVAEGQRVIAPAGTFDLLAAVGSPSPSPMNRCWSRSRSASAASSCSWPRGSRTPISPHGNSLPRRP